MPKAVSIILILVLLPLFLFSGHHMVFAHQDSAPKAIILVMDYVDTVDLLNAHTPNFDMLIDNSSIGLMNIRAKNSNPSSSYMSLAAGKRVGTIPNAGLAYNSNEMLKEVPGVFTGARYPLESGQLYTVFTGRPSPINGVVNLFTESIIKNSQNHTPAYEIGQLGTIAQENGIKIAVLGNADTIYGVNRNIVLLGMDEFGAIPYGNVSEELIERNPKSPGGMRSNHNTLLENLEKMLATADIIMIDSGDTTRVEECSQNCSDEILLIHRRDAIERNDALLGEIINRIDLNNTLLVIITPNTTREMRLDNNFGLTPVIMYKPGSGKSLLTSNTTRRPGIVSNTDFLPTISSYFNLDDKFTKDGFMTLSTTNNSMEKINKQLEFLKKLRKCRNPLHYLFMFLGFLTLIFGFLIYIGKKQKLLHYMNPLVFSTLSIPIIFLFIGYTGYTSVGGTVFLSLIAALVAALLLRLIIKNPVTVLALLTGITALLLVIDCFTGSGLMLSSPLGSDAIAGGRYYGIGNDYMGVLIASTVIFSVLLSRKIPLNPLGRALLSVLPLLLVSVAIGHPQYGANVGGLITSVVTMGIFFLIISEKKLNFKQFIAIGILAFLGVVIVAQLDAMFSANPSHAGKAINSLFIGGPAILKDILKTKLTILSSTIYNSNWSIVLIISLTFLSILWFKKPRILPGIIKKQDWVGKIVIILFVSATTVFLVNDTGVIACALIILYLISCIFVQLYLQKHP